MTFKYSHRTVFYFLQLVRFVRCCTSVWDFTLKIFKSRPNCWHRVIDITSFEKHLESSSDHTPNFCRNLVIFRSKNICQKEYFTFFYGDLVYKLRRVKDTPNFILSISKPIKRLRRRQYDPLIIERTIGLVLGPSLYSLVQTFPKALHSD